MEREHRKEASGQMGEMGAIEANGGKVAGGKRRERRQKANRKRKTKEKNGNEKC